LISGQQGSKIRTYTLSGAIQDLDFLEDLKRAFLFPHKTFGTAIAFVSRIPPG
jgi:hypothetical protein